MSDYMIDIPDNLFEMPKVVNGGMKRFKKWPSDGVYRVIYKDLRTNKLIVGIWHINDKTKKEYRKQFKNINPMFYEKVPVSKLWDVKM